MLLSNYFYKVVKNFYNFFLNKMKFFDFKFSSKLFHNLTPLISNFFCPTFLNTRGKKKLDEFGFQVLCECIFSNLVNLS